jgi:hypothetical protein
MTPDLSQLAVRAYPDTFAEWASLGKFKPYDYQRLISREVARAIYGGRGRILIAAPPRYGKSEFAAVWIPTWFLDNWPHKKVILASYGAELAEKWGRACRDNFLNIPHLATRLDPDSRSAGRWNTPQKGGMMCVGTGGGIIGFGGDLVVIDDPTKSYEEAQNPKVRNEIYDWFVGTLYSRLEPNATIVVDAQMFHRDDLINRLKKEHADLWNLLRFPIFAEKDDILGRKEGDVLCPERYPADEVRLSMLAVPRARWLAMMQQAPVFDGSGLVYSRYDPYKHLKDNLALRRDLPLQLSFDFNVNPGMHVLVGQYDSRLDLFTTVYEIHGERMKTAGAMAAFGKYLKAIGGWQFSYCEVFGDRSGRTETTTTTDTDYTLIHQWFLNAHIPVVFRVPLANPPIKSRVESANEVLLDSQDKIHWYIDRLNCPRLLADLENLAEGVDGLPDKTNRLLSHSSDAISYAIHMQRPVVTLLPQKSSFRTNAGSERRSRVA